MFNYSVPMLALVSAVAPAFAQDTTWRCTYGGAGYDEGRSVIETFDTCYMVAGATGSFGYGDADVIAMELENLQYDCETNQYFNKPLLKNGNKM